MAIKETSKKIHFTPFVNQKGRMTDTDPAPTVTLNKGKLSFGPKIISELNLEGKFIQFAYDQTQNIIGFRVKEVLDQRLMKQWKLVKQNATSKFYQASLGQIITAVFGEKVANTKYKNIPIQKYREAFGMDKGEVYYFFKLESEYIDNSEKRKSATPAITSTS